MRRVLVTGLLLLPAIATAQSPTERGEVAWKAGTVFAIQGNADSALTAFYRARDIAESVKDSHLLAASLRAAAEVQQVYFGCADSSLTLLRRAVSVSADGDRAAGLLLIRRLAATGKADEARALHVKLYEGLKDEVPRSISRESISYLTGQAAIQRAVGQHVAALASLRSARSIADRLATGDVVDSATAKSLTDISSQNYWVTYALADLMLNSKTRGVMSPTEGKTLMNAVANATDEPEEGNERRFETFRLSDRLALKAWRCTMNGEKCEPPPPRTCR
jgi:tetratricopeptide (TPR) repeat protein